MRTIIQTLLFILFSFSLTLHASNGGLFIGYGVKSQAMGGIGIATYVGTDSALKNPAMLVFNDSNQVNLVYSQVTDDASVTADGNISEDYIVDKDPVVNFGFLKNIDKNFVFAIQSATTYSNNVKFNNSTEFNYFHTSLVVNETAISLAYKYHNLSLGWSTILTDAYYDEGNYSQEMTFEAASTLSYQAGLAYTLGSLTFASTFKSPRKLYFKESWASYSSFNKMPAELGVGLDYNNKKFNVALDIKQIFWSEAMLNNPNTSTDVGFGAVGFKDQTVFALGLSYTLGSFVLRAGVNYAEHPLSDLALSNGEAYKYPVLNETHYTGGISLKLSRNTELEVSYVYAETNNVPINSATTPMAITLTNTNYTADQLVTNFGLKIKF